VFWAFPHFAFSSIREHDKPVRVSPSALNSSQRVPSIAVSGFAYSNPGRTLKDTIHRVLEAVTKESLKRNSEKRRLLLRRAIHDRFDFERMAQSTLQGHWQKRTFYEKYQFVGLLQKLLEQTFLRFIENYQEGNLHYLEESVQGNQALVKTWVMTPSSRVSVDYRLVFRNGEWRVYDFQVDGLSITHAYRSQFLKILKGGSFRKLLKRLQDQTA
jgi:phospholipid transport system substrate-binding protein